MIVEKLDTGRLLETYTHWLSRATAETYTGTGTDVQYPIKNTVHCVQAFRNMLNRLKLRDSGRVVDLGPSVYQGGPKFEIKHKSRCLQRSKLVNRGSKHVDWEGGRFP